jgi:hypothetical protein
MAAVGLISGLGPSVLDTTGFVSRVIVSGSEAGTFAGWLPAVGLAAVSSLVVNGCAPAGFTSRTLTASTAFFFVVLFVVFSVLISGSVAFCSVRQMGGNPAQMSSHKMSGRHSKQSLFHLESE